jgi:TRAP-type uncharacterized transport system substrate-binding protein
MDRRRFIRLGLCGAALVLTSGHTPYRQWVVYRKRRLLIGTSRADAPSYPLGKQVAETLLTYLPESKARASRAPDPWRLASLLSTAQMDVAILSATDAAAMVEGRAPFADFGGVALSGLFGLGDYLLVARADFPARHAYLVSRTLYEHRASIPDARPLKAAVGALPIHPGTLAYQRGEPLPASAD